MRGSFLLLCCLTLLFTAVSAVDCGSVAGGCRGCLNLEACGWSNYTNSCINKDSGLALLDHCPDYREEDDTCMKLNATCITCISGKSKDCGWNDGKCLWLKATNHPQLVSKLNQCPWYNFSSDPCHTGQSCQNCLENGCAWSNSTSACVTEGYAPVELVGELTHNITSCTPEAVDPCIGSAVKCSDCTGRTKICSWYANASICARPGQSNKYGPESQATTPGCADDRCLLYKDCEDCVARTNCVWSNSTCVNNASSTVNWTLPSWQYGDRCPWNVKKDDCVRTYNRLCVRALMSKEQCAWLQINNTAVSRDSGLSGLTTDVSLCPPLVYDAQECDGSQFYNATCDRCHLRKGCGWDAKTQHCRPLNARNASFVTVCDDYCSRQLTCDTCSDIARQNHTCSWSFLNNTCIKSRNITVQLITKGETEETTKVAITCPKVPDPCSPEYLKPYLCASNYTDIPFDTHKCYPTSIYKSPACIAGFFESKQNTTSFSGTRNTTERVNKCCPGYMCPKNYVCITKCATGAFCPTAEVFYPPSDKDRIIRSNVTSQPMVEEESAIAANSTEKVYCAPYEELLSPQVGCGGATNNSQCPAGFYCPNTTTRYWCPAGYFCRAGSTEPTNCYPPPLYKLLAIGIVCDAGSSYPGSRLPVVFLLPLGLILVPLAFYAKNKYNAWKAKRVHSQLRSTKLEDTSDERLSTESGHLAVPLLSPEIKETKTPLIDIDDLYIFPIEPVNIVFEDLTVTLSNGTVILDDITGSFLAGRLTAIMGPSGSGKTTLLSAIMGKTDGTTGAVCPTVQDCKSVIGFVPQEDIMHRELTVRENMMFSAQIRLPRSVSRKDRRRIVDTAIELLGLSHVAHSVVGDESVRGISGGQRKRANIGIELVTCPSVLFLDEPTSGLDSSMSLSICAVLKRLTEANVNVIAVIHQPRYDIFDQFDDILLLKKGGILAYLGPRSDVIAHFERQGFPFPERQNPCDHFLDLISGPYKDAIRPNDVASSTVERKEPERRYQANYLMQTWYIFVCGLRQQWRQLMMYHSDLMLAIFSGIIVGLIQSNTEEKKIPEASFLLVLVASMTSMVVSQRLYGGEKVVFWRQSSAGMSSTSYFFGKNLGSFPSFLLTAFFFLLFYYTLSQPRGDLHWYFALLLANHFCVSGLSHLLSIFLELHKAQLFGVVLVMIQCAVSGFSPTLADLKKIHILVYWLAQCSFARWSMEAIYIFNTNKLSEVHKPTEDLLITIFGYDTSRLSLDMGLLVAMGAGWRVLSWLALIFANRKQRR